MKMRVLLILLFSALIIMDLELVTGLPYHIGKLSCSCLICFKLLNKDLWFGFDMVEFDGVLISTRRFIWPSISKGDVDVDNIFITEDFHSDFLTGRLTIPHIVIEVICTHFICCICILMLFQLVLVHLYTFFEMFKAPKNKSTSNFQPSAIMSGLDVTFTFYME